MIFWVVVVEQNNESADDGADQIFENQLAPGSLALWRCRAGLVVRIQLSDAALVVT